MTNPLTCPQCDRPYGKRRRCYVCSSANRRTGTVISCPVCGAEMYVQPNQVSRGEGKFCSPECKVVGDTGRERVTGTRYVRLDGYIVVKVGLRKYELEHRFVMAKHLGRKLGTDEHVHHVDGDRANNALTNLAVMSNAEHQRLHDHLGVMHIPVRVSLTCQVCGGTYQVRNSRASTSTTCSAVCRMVKARAARKRNP